MQISHFGDLLDIIKKSVLEFDFQNAFMKVARCLEVDVDVHS